MVINGVWNERDGSSTAAENATPSRGNECIERLEQLLAVPEVVGWVRGDDEHALPGPCHLSSRHQKNKTSETISS